MVRVKLVKDVVASCDSPPRAQNVCFPRLTVLKLPVRNRPFATIEPCFLRYV